MLEHREDPTKAANDYYLLEDRDWICTGVSVVILLITWIFCML